MSKRISRHEDSKKHQRNVRAYDEQQHIAQVDTGTSSGEIITNDTALIHGPLVTALQQVAERPGHHESSHGHDDQDNWVNEATGVVDWDSIELNTSFESSTSARATMLLADELIEYLQQNNINSETDDDDEGKSVSGVSSLSSKPSSPGPTRLQLPPVNEATTWYPWPNKEVSISSHQNSPCCKTAAYIQPR